MSEEHIRPLSTAERSRRDRAKKTEGQTEGVLKMTSPIDIQNLVTPIKICK